MPDFPSCVPATTLQRAPSFTAARLLAESAFIGGVLQKARGHCIARFLYSHPRRAWIGRPVPQPGVRARIHACRKAQKRFYRSAEGGFADDSLPSAGRRRRSPARWSRKYTTTTNPMNTTVNMK